MSLEFHLFFFFSRFRGSDESPIFRKSKLSTKQQCDFKNPQFEQQIWKDMASWQWESSQTCFFNKSTLRQRLSMNFEFLVFFIRIN